MHHYDTGRNLPGQPGTSMLSAAPALGRDLARPGLGGGRRRRPRQAARKARGVDVYLGEILWREFAAYLLWHNPHLPGAAAAPALRGPRAPETDAG